MCVNAFFRANYSATAPIWLAIGLRPDLNWRIAEDNDALATLHMAEAVLPRDLRRIVVSYVPPKLIGCLIISDPIACLHTLHHIYMPLAWWFCSDPGIARSDIAIPYGSRWVSISSRDI